MSSVSPSPLVTRSLLASGTYTTPLGLLQILDLVRAATCFEVDNLHRAVAKNSGEQSRTFGVKCQMIDSARNVGKLNRLDLGKRGRLAPLWCFALLRGAGDCSDGDQQSKTQLLHSSQHTKYSSQVRSRLRG